MSHINNNNNRNNSTSDDSNTKNTGATNTVPKHNNNNNNNTTGSSNADQEYLQNKVNRIVSLLNEPMIDVWALRTLGITNGGYVNDQLRRKVWPKLVGLHSQIWDFTTTKTSTSGSNNNNNNNTTTGTRQRCTTEEESLVATPKRSNVVVVNSNSKNNATTTNAKENCGGGSNSNTPSNTTTTTFEHSYQTKKVQDIFRSEVVNSNLPKSSVSSVSSSLHKQHAPNRKSRDNSDDTNSISSSSGSLSSSSMSGSSAMTLRHRNHHHHQILASSIDATQIELDVLRCTWHLLTKSQKRCTQQQHQQQQYIVEGATTSTTTAAVEGGSQQQQQIRTNNNSSSSSSSNRRKLRKIAKMIQRKQRRLSNLINLTLIQSSPVGVTAVGGVNNEDGCTMDPYHSHSTTTTTSNDILRYYQGYHDVACIVLSTIGISATFSRYVPPLPFSVPDTIATTTTTTTATGFEMATSILYQLSQSHFRDCMRHNFTQLQIVMRLTIFPLLSYFDTEIHEHLMLSDMMEPYFCLSWIITWFSHDIRDTELVKRLFDFFIVSHPMMPIYMTIAMICHPFNRLDVLQTEHDFSTVHQTLSQLPRNSSMVGWKYRPGDGYVSDDDDNTDDDNSSDDDDMDDDLLSVGPMGSQSSVDTEFLLHEAATMKQSNHSGHGRTKMTSTAGACNDNSYVADAEAVSIVSSSMSSIYNARVPFQELIDLAIQYIGKIPPNHLIILATRYYGQEYVQKELFSTSSPSSSPPPPHVSPTKCNGINFSHPIRNDITFLQSPPTWTHSYTAHSDQTLKYYRTQQRRRSRSMTVQEENTAVIPESITQVPEVNEPDEVDSMYKLFQSNGDTEKLIAVIAAGYGMGDDMTELRVRRKRKQRKRFIQAGTALAVMVVAIGIGYYLQQQRNRSGQQPQSSIGTAKTTGGTSLDGSICTADVVDKNPFSNRALNKIIATSTKISKDARTPKVVSHHRVDTNTNIMDTKHVNKTWQRQLFERTCPVNPSTNGSNNIGTDLSSQIILNRRMLGSSNFDWEEITQRLHELGMVSTIQYKKTVHNLSLFGNHIRNIGTTLILPEVSNKATKSKRLLVETHKVLVQKTRDLYHSGATVIRHTLDNIPQNSPELFQNAYHHGVTRLKNGILVKTNRLVVSTTKAMNVAKTAMIEYGNDVVATNTHMDMVTPPPPIIVKLRKTFEPSDLNIISAHLHSILRRSLYIPVINTINNLRFTRDALPTALGHTIGQQPVTTLIEIVRTVYNKVVNIVKSPTVQNTLRGAALLDHYNVSQITSNTTNDIPKIQLDVDRLYQQFVNTIGEQTDSRRTRSGKDRCLSNLSSSRTKKLQFVK